MAMFCLARRMKGRGLVAARALWMPSRDATCFSPASCRGKRNGSSELSMKWVCKLANFEVHAHTETCTKLLPETAAWKQRAMFPHAVPPCCILRCNEHTQSTAVVKSHLLPCIQQDDVAGLPGCHTL